MIVDTDDDENALILLFSDAIWKSGLDLWREPAKFIINFY
jgi:hypothetical protein